MSENRFEFRQNGSCNAEILKLLTNNELSHINLFKQMSGFDKQQIQTELNKLQATGKVGSKMVNGKKYYYIKNP